MKGITYVDRRKGEGIARNLGLSLTQLDSGWLKITGSVPDRAVYLNAGKKSRHFSDVHLSGFTHGLGVPFGLSKKGEETNPSNRVLQRLDRTLPEERLLRSLFVVLRDGLVEGKGDTIAATRGTRGRPVASQEEIDEAILLASVDE